VDHAHVVSGRDPRDGAFWQVTPQLPSGPKSVRLELGGIVHSFQKHPDVRKSGVD
jgi:hypothetical protein